MEINTKKAAKLPRIKTGIWILEILFCLGCLIYSLCISAYAQAIGCAATMLLVSLPILAEKLFKQRLQLPFFIFCSLYALGPMMGDVFLLYYTTAWWDELLHFIGGIVFAILGVALLRRMNPKNTALLCAIFALCFSVTVAAVWEFCEYGMDRLAGTDAQQDTIVHEINSYLLGDQIDAVEHMKDIRQTVVDGRKIEGYIDIGLHDTMTDMLFETLGALTFSTAFLYITGRKKKTEKNATG